METQLLKVIYAVVVAEVFYWYSPHDLVCKRYITLTACLLICFTHSLILCLFSFQFHALWFEECCHNYLRLTVSMSTSSEVWIYTVKVGKSLEVKFTIHKTEYVKTKRMKSIKIRDQLFMHKAFVQVPGTHLQTYYISHVYKKHLLLKKFYHYVFVLGKFKHAIGLNSINKRQMKDLLPYKRKILGVIQKNLRLMNVKDETSQKLQFLLHINSHFIS